MPIFVAKTYKGLTESIIMARNLELARVYWQGSGVIPHSIKEINEDDLRDHPTGVVPIVRTEKINASLFGEDPKEYLTISSE